jgi:sialic acid synthase SpsE
MVTKSTTTPAKTMAKKTVPAKRKVTAVKPIAAKPETVKVATTKPDKKIKKEKKPKKAASKTVSKVKVVRDSFTMPKSDYDKIDALKQVCLKAGLHVKKSELLRAGLHALSALSTAQLKISIGKLAEIKTGRPKKTTP